MKHYLFCLRHFNDIDNITPAIHFLLERRPVRVTILIYSLDYDYRSDPSLKFLQRTWGERLRVVWIGALAGYSQAPGDKVQLRDRIGQLWPKLRRRWRRLINPSIQNWHVSREDSAYQIKAWLKPLFVDWGRPESVIFDQNRASAIAGLLSALRQLGVQRIISLPVSPWININVLRQTDFIRVDADVFAKKHDYSGFDAIGQVDYYYRNSLKTFFNFMNHPSPFGGRECVLGSIRFTEEWLKIRDSYTKTSVSAVYLPSVSTKKRRLLVIPSHRKNNSFWEEYIRTLHFIAQFDGYDIVVKPHTRYGNDYDDLPEEITLLPEIDTSSLIDWSEIILFWSSSVALEGF